MDFYSALRQLLQLYSDKKTKLRRRRGTEPEQTKPNPPEDEVDECILISEDGVTEEVKISKFTIE